MSQLHRLFFPLLVIWPAVPLVPLPEVGIWLSVLVPLEMLSWYGVWQLRQEREQYAGYKEQGRYPLYMPDHIADRHHVWGSALMGLLFAGIAYLDSNTSAMVIASICVAMGIKAFVWRLILKPYTAL